MISQRTEPVLRLSLLYVAFGRRRRDIHCSDDPLELMCPLEHFR